LRLGCVAPADADGVAALGKAAGYGRADGVACADQYCYAALFCHPCFPIKFLFDTEKIPAFRVIVNGFCPDARVNKRLRRFLTVQ
jgi:hypothetical protein